MRVNRRRLMVASDIAKLEEIQQSPNSNVGDRDLQAIVDPMGDSRFCIDGIHLLLCTSNVGDRDLQAIVDPMGDSRVCIDGIHLLLCTLCASDHDPPLLRHRHWA
jgi:hypothetical protein